MNSIHCRRRGLMAGVAAILVGAAVPARAIDTNAVIEPIRRLIDGLLAIMKAGPATPFRQRFSMLAPVIDQTFNLSAVLQESVGAGWAALPPQQQAMLTDAFRRYTVVSYVNSFNHFSGERFEITPTTRAVGPEQVVQTRIIPQSGTGHELDYVMRDSGSGWRVVDVLADGSISRVAVQRSDFRRLLTRGGPQALADSLSNKSLDLSDGAA